MKLSKKETGGGEKMNLRKECPEIKSRPTESHPYYYELGWRIDDFNDWRNSEDYEPILGICNRVTSILWRAYDCKDTELFNETVEVANYLLKNLPKDSENYDLLKSRLEQRIKKSEKP